MLVWLALLIIGAFFAGILWLDRNDEHDDE